MDVNLPGDLTPLSDGRTRASATMGLVPHGLFRLVAPVLVRVMQKMEEKNLAALKAAMERRNASAEFWVHHASSALTAVIRPKCRGGRWFESTEGLRDGVETEQSGGFGSQSPSPWRSQPCHAFAEP